METTQARLLEASAELFSENGFEGVSMRQIARAADITQAAIYHHFPNKGDLYIAAIQHIYAGRTRALVSRVSGEDDAKKQLALLVSSLLQVFDEQPQFRRIYFRELLAGNRERLEMMVGNVFPELGDLINSLMSELAPRMDSHLMVLTLSGLILHHLEARKLSEFMEGSGPEHQDTDTLAAHITHLLLHGVSGP
jgi:AcrR family transcriptional regulator